LALVSESVFGSAAGASGEFFLPKIWEEAGEDVANKKSANNKIRILMVV